MPTEERRRDARHSIDRPLKVQSVLTGKYHAGQLRDVSSGGMALVVTGPGRLEPGERVRVGVAWGWNQTVIPSKDMHEATVLRSVGFDGNQHVAVRFNERQRLAMAS